MRVDKDELRSFLLSCRRPRVVDNRRGQPVLVSCGRCPECLMRKSARNTILALQESSENKYCFFITLTYDDANIPVAMIKDKNESRYFIDLTRRKLHPKIDNSPYRTSSTYKQVLFTLNKENIDEKLFKRYYKKSRSKSKYFKRKPFPYIPILCKEDLQKFIKRLRFQISKEFDEEVRYFACGEYGPKTFRPHFHIELFFNEPRLLAKLQDIVNTCWQYGASHCEPVRQRNGVASYASAYCNSASVLPSFYQNKSISPFIAHSCYLGARSNPELCKYVKAFDIFPFDNFTISTSTGFRDISFSSTLKHYLFPRCYDYDNKVSRLSSKFYQTLRAKTFGESTGEFYTTSLDNDFYSHSEFLTSDFYKLYNLYPLFLESYADDSCSRLTRYFLIECDYLHYLLDIPQFDKTQFELQLKDIDDFHISLFNKVYSAFRISKRVYENAKYAHMSFEYYLIKLISFYNQLKQHQLKQFYEMQEEYQNRTACDDFSIFYYIGKDFSPFRHRFHRNSNIQNFKAESNVIFHEKIKHKELNDANLIFNNL